MLWFFRRFGSKQRLLQTSPFRFQWLGGRQRLANSPYLLPIDLSERHRLYFQHYILRQILQGNYLAPLYHPQSILDVGCGTGIWLLEVAARFPQARVVGLDLVSPTPDERTQQLKQLPNYQFVQADLLQGLPFPDASFDFVHQRFLAGAIPLKQWPGTVRELVRVTSRKGWIEIIESGTPQEAGPALEVFLTWGKMLANERGIDLDGAKNLKQHLTEAGCTSLTVQELRLPIGSEGGRVGQLLLSNGLALIEGMQALVLQKGLATPQEYEKLSSAVRQELSQGRAIQPFYLAYGQRR